MTKATDLITAERERQITEEGYDADRDRGRAEQLTYAATAYAIESSAAISLAGDGRTPDANFLVVVPAWWPWSSNFWKPTGDPIADLTKAGALIAAAIDSLIEETADV